MGPKKAAAKPAGKKAAPKPAAKAAPASTGGGKGVYIKQLAFAGMNHDTVKQAFKACGAVTSVQLRRKKYCIVHFGEASHAAKAKEMNGQVVKGNKIKVEVAKKAAPPNRKTACKTVYVGGLARMPRKDVNKGGVLKKEFAKYGQVTKLRTYRHGGGMHAFVYFKDNAAATKAVETLDSQTLKPFSKGNVSVRYSLRTKESDAKKEKVRQKRIAAKRAAKKAKQASK
eukprot:TRINITY_DN578_c0_g1_i1.p2 TRINITY_DN578_c0_g1~~TRINITY_DN578_c0_g1_i1.p2  ORF type:complete len:227 (+),score=93.65 TRINITY_DN578_c0_g1_i1:61-741(+)